MYVADAGMPGDRPSADRVSDEQPNESTHGRALSVTGNSMRPGDETTAAALYFPPSAARIGANQGNVAPRRYVFG